VEIDSPPFPKNSTNPEQLHNFLRDLYYWVEGKKDWANMEASRLNAPEQPYIPDMGPYPSEDANRYLQLAVPDMFVSWQAMRAIREKYDAVVRSYEEEEAWLSDACIFHRINIVKLAALLLTMAFLDREKREAKEMELIKRQRKSMLQTLKNAFGDIQGLFSGEDHHNDDDEIDFDSLFNPPEGE
jgi:hypothetical protein